MTAKTLSIASDFSRSPAGRTPADGPFNGQRFRKQFLIPAMQEAIASNGRVIVDLAGAYNYSSSFLEEIFGGVVREGIFSTNDIKRVLEIRSHDRVYDPFVRDAKRYLFEAMGEKVAA